jgi:phage terminase small subunit
MSANGPPKPRPPDHLSERAKTLYRKVVATYILDPTGLALLRLLGEAMDTAEDARLAIERDGPYVATKSAVRAHAALGVQRDASIRVARLARELNLGDLGPDHPPSRWG